MRGLKFKITPRASYARVIYYALSVSVIGGAEEDRTPDPLLAKQVLSQLSYSPLNFQ